MYVLLALESLALLFEFIAKHDVQVLSLIRSLLVPNTIHIKLWVVGVLHIVACMMSVSALIDTSLHEISVQLVDKIELTLEVNHWTGLTLLINKV